VDESLWCELEAAQERQWACTPQRVSARSSPFLHTSSERAAGMAYFVAYRWLSQSLWVLRCRAQYWARAGVVTERHRRARVECGVTIFNSKPI